MKSAPSCQLQRACWPVPSRHQTAARILMSLAHIVSQIVTNAKGQMNNFMIANPQNHFLPPL
jgi:hypothetical protein